MAQPSSSMTASGSSWRRTAEPAPSAPASRSPTADVPSAACAVTRPSGAGEYPVKFLPKRTSSPASRISRRVSRLTPNPPGPGRSWCSGFPNFGDSRSSRNTIRAAARDGGRHGQVEQVRWQALVQRARAGGLETDPIPLVPEPGGLVTFADGGADAGLAQPLGQAQAANPSSGDHDMQAHDRRLAVATVNVQTAIFA